MSNDVLITPASRKIEFKDSSANVDAKIETDASGNLVITNTGGDISIGDTTSDIFVGDGTNNIDIVFEQDGEIRGTSGVTVTLGASGSNIRMASDLNLNSNDITNVNDLTVAGNLTVSGTTTTVNSTNTTISDSIIELNSGLTGANTKDIGFIFERGSTGNNAGFVWDESADRFTVFTTTDTASSDTVNTSSVANFQAGSFYGNGANLTSLNGSNISSGTVAAARIASLAASKITSGTFADARIAASSITQHTDSKYLRSNADDTATGLITLGNGVIITKASSDQNTSADSASIPSTTGAEIVKFQGGYTNGAYTTEFAKVDRSGNLPLYVRQSLGTANSFSNIARFGGHGQSNGSDMFAVFGGARVDGRVTAQTLTLSSLSAQNSEATSLMINGSGVVGTRELGSNAFNSTTIPTNNNQLTNGAGYITGLSFNGLSAKTSGTGTYSTSGYFQAGRGSGGVALTHNDGYGNANVTFNHVDGIPEQGNNCGRIVVNTDGTTAAKMTFELLSNTGTSAVNTPSAMELTESGMYIPNYLYHLADTDTYLKFDANRVRIVAGGATKFDSNNTYLTSISSSDVTGALGFTPYNATNPSGYITGNQTITLSGDVSGSGTTSIAVTIADDSHNHVISNVDGLATAFDNSYITAESASNLAVGWYTIATNTGDRATARFGIWDTNSSDHQSVTFYAAHHFGTNASNTLTILDNSRYSGSPFRYIRIKDAGTYDGAVLQVYIDDATNAVNAAILGDNFQSSGWVLQDWVADATTPSGVSNYSSFGERAKVDLNNIDQGGFATTGEIYAGGDTTQYRVFHDNYHPNADTLTTARTIGGVSFNGSANINLPGVNTAGNQNTSGTAAGLSGTPNITVGTITLSVDTADALNFSANSTNDSRGISFNNRTALTADNSDGWLRLNQLSEFSNGVYTPGNLRVDGNLYMSSRLEHVGDSNTYIQFHSADQFRVVTGGSERLEVNNSEVKLTNNGILSSGGQDLRLRRNSTNNESINIGGTVIQFFLTGSEDMRLTNNGNLDLEGDITAFSNVVASDERLKDNVVTIENAVDKVSQLRGVEFVWNKGKREGKQSIGVIAQEVEKVLPEVVIEKELPLMEEGTTYKTVDYPKLTAVLIEAIKEQQETINKLTSRMNDIEKENNNGNN